MADCTRRLFSQLSGSLLASGIAGCAPFGSLHGIEFGQGTYGFTAPAGVEPPVVAGFVWWRFGTEGEVAWRGLFWLQPTDSRDRLATETGDPRELTLDDDGLREIADRYYPETGAPRGLYALQPNRSALRVPSPEAESRLILETIVAERHLPAGSEAAATFRDHVAPHLKTIRTPLSWRHVRKPEQAETWPAPGERTAR